MTTAKKPLRAWVVFDAELCPVSHGTTKINAWCRAWIPTAYARRKFQRDGWRCVRMVEAPKKRRAKR